MYGLAPREGQTGVNQVVGGGRDGSGRLEVV